MRQAVDQLEETGGPIREKIGPTVKQCERCRKDVAEWAADYLDCFPGETVCEKCRGLRITEEYGSDKAHAEVGLNPRMPENKWRHSATGHPKQESY